MSRDQRSEAAVDFDDFYLAEFGSVVRLAYVLSGNPAIAEDLAQEAFLAAHGRWERIASYEQPAAWVRRVVANLSVSAFRRQMTEARALVRLVPADRMVMPALPIEDMEFWDAVRSLPRRQTQVITLYYLEDRSVVEIATILEIAEGTVKKHLHDGREQLARVFREEVSDDDR